MVVLTRDERRRQVLELDDQGLGARGIVEILHMSFRDIAEILKNANRVKEVGQQQAHQQLLFSRTHIHSSPVKGCIKDTNLGLSQIHTNSYNFVSVYEILDTRGSEWVRVKMIKTLLLLTIPLLLPWSNSVGGLGTVIVG